MCFFVAAVAAVAATPAASSAAAATRMMRRLSKRPPFSVPGATVPAHRKGTRKEGVNPYPFRMFLFQKPATMITAADALPGRSERMPVPGRHEVLGTPLFAPFPDGLEQAVVAMGCFWGAERVFWQAPGVYTTAVGYAGGFTANPTYEEVCSGRTGHSEAVLVVFDPRQTSYQEILRLFWENHDPTQGMRQGNDAGTQYRSAVYWDGDAQREAAETSRAMFQAELAEAGYGEITTEIAPAGPFYYAEAYHQQYLAKNPNGYCGLGGTGVACPVGLQR